jgi:cytochrome c551/c552
MRSILAVSLLMVVVATGCGGGDANSDGSAVASFGLELLNERVVDSNPGCITCHSLDEDVTLVGPSLFGLGGRAGDQVPGLSATEYLRQAIVDPDAFVVDGFGAGLMVSEWADSLTEAQIESLVEVLLDL